MYEVFAHTADLGLHIEARDLNTLFAEAGLAFFSVIVANLHDVKAETSTEFNIQGCDAEYLLADWLNELLFVFESRRLLLCQFDVAVSEHGLQGTGKGEIVDENRHHLEHEIKAVTYHGLSVQKVGENWVAEVILDI